MDTNTWIVPGISGAIIVTQIGQSEDSPRHGHLCPVMAVIVSPNEEQQQPKYRQLTEPQIYFPYIPSIFVSQYVVNTLSAPVWSIELKIINYCDRQSVTINSSSINRFWRGFRSLDSIKISHATEYSVHWSHRKKRRQSLGIIFRAFHRYSPRKNLIAQILINKFWSTNSDIRIVFILF